MHTEKEFYRGKAYRIVSGALGMIFVIAGLFVLILADTHISLRLPCGIGIILLGANMIWAASHGKESWLSKIGPLP